MLDIEARFWELCDRSTRHDEAYSRKLGDDSVSPEEARLEARASEQAMVEMIRLVEENPDHRRRLCAAFPSWCCGSGRRRTCWWPFACGGFGSRRSRS